MNPLALAFLISWIGFQFVAMTWDWNNVFKPMPTWVKVFQVFCILTDLLLFPSGSIVLFMMFMVGTGIPGWFIAEKYTITQLQLHERFTGVTIGAAISVLAFGFYQFLAWVI